MWNRPTPQQLATIPTLYATENVAIEDKIIHMHFFIGGSDWYAVEYSPEEERFFGFVILNDDLQNAEWGYFDFLELCEASAGRIEVDHDLHWMPRRAGDVANIRKAQGVNK